MNEFHLADRPPVAQAIAAAAACATLDELQAAIEAFDGSDLAKRYPAPNRKEARIANPLMIVAEKPEIPQDFEAGEPFSGPSGGVMREMLEWSGVDMDAVHVEYAVHWTPENERAVNATQISQSRPFLFRAIEIVRPRAILVPGKGAYEAMFNRRDRISELLGMTMAFKRGDMTIPSRIVYHPAFPARFRSEIPEYAEQIRSFVDDYAKPEEVTRAPRDFLTARAA